MREEEEKFYSPCHTQSIIIQSCVFIFILHISSVSFLVIAVKTKVVCGRDLISGLLLN